MGRYVYIELVRSRKVSMSPGYKAMPMADWPNFPCDLHAGSHVVECCGHGVNNIEEVCMTSCDWPIPSLSVSLRNCTIDKVSLSIAMAILYYRTRCNIMNTLIPGGVAFSGCNKEEIPGRTVARDFDKIWEAADGKQVRFLCRGRGEETKWTSVTLFVLGCHVRLLSQRIIWIKYLSCETCASSFKHLVPKHH